MAYQPDKARKQTDKKVRKLEKRLESIFNDAKQDLIKKAYDYLKDFQRLDNQKRDAVQRGEITQAEYIEWRKNKLLYGQHWKRLIDDVSEAMTERNKMAVEIVNNEINEVFALNYNSLAEVIKDSPVKGYSFELIDADTVKKLSRSDKVLLPPKKQVNISKDEKWNAKQVNAQLMQGILQGESIPKIAERMANVCNSNEKASIRNARTMITAAENSGRQSGMNRAVEDGIIIKKMWIATRDERTRETHMDLNGTLVDPDESFETENGEIYFPGDWAAPPCEVYNCRCTLGYKVLGFKSRR